MTMIGYARVSSAGQSLEVQRDQLKAAGCERVFEEKRSGTTREGRDQLALALDFVRDGDVFVVTRLDRLARSVVDLRKIVDTLTAKGVDFRVLQQQGIDTTRAEGRLFLTILAAFAEWENAIRRERQLDGIARAKAEGVYKGRPPTLDATEVRRLKEEGVKPAHIAKRLGISRDSVYRLMKIGTDDGGG